MGSPIKFYFPYDIFQGETTITGPIHLEIKRTELWAYPELEESNLNYDSLLTVLASENKNHGWQELDPKSESFKKEIHSRFNAAACNGIIEKQEEMHIETSITLERGLNFQHSFRYATEEGYQERGLTVNWVEMPDYKDGYWEVESYFGGRDCDGESSQTTEYTINGFTHKVSDSKSRNYDQYAEMAGY